MGIGTALPTSNLQIDNPQGDLFGGGGFLTTDPGLTINNVVNLTSPSWPVAFFPNIMEVWQKTVVAGVPNPEKLPIFIIKTLDGKVGIGLDNPATKLDVLGDLHASSDMSIGGNGQIAGTLRLGPTESVSPYNGYRLSVDGDIICKRAVVQVYSWADDVFDVDYKPMPLAALSAYIKSNHHLPDVPSTEDVMKNGADVAEMNAILLRKVEELTLYVLDLKKENEEMRKQISQLTKYEILFKNKN